MRWTEAHDETKHRKLSVPSMKRHITVCLFFAFLGHQKAYINKPHNQVGLHYASHAILSVNNLYIKPESWCMRCDAF